MSASFSTFVPLKGCTCKLCTKVSIPILNSAQTYHIVYLVKINLHYVIIPIFCKQNIPTVKPFPAFNAETDATALRTAVKGLGTNNEEITRILGTRTANQRHEIELAYKKLFDRDLIADLKSDLSGHFERLVVSLFYPWPQHNARVIEQALNGFFGSDERTMVDLLATASNCELKEIKKAYKERKLCFMS